jgi:hypothetical protein
MLWVNAGLRKAYEIYFMSGDAWETHDVFITNRLLIVALSPF